MKNFSLLFLFLIPSFLFAQNISNSTFKFESSAPYPSISTRFNDIFPDGNGNFFSIKTKSLKVSVQKFSIETLKEITNQPFDLKEGSKFEKIIQGKDKLFYLFTVINEKDNNAMYCREINLIDGTCSEPKLLFESSGRYYFVEFLESLDKSNFLIKYRRNPKSSNNKINKDLIGFHAFTSTLEKISSGEVEMLYIETMMKIVSLTITNNKQVFFLSYINEANKFEITEVKNSEILKASRINLDAANTQLSFKEIKLRESLDGNLVFAGYYWSSKQLKVDIIGGGISFHNELSMNGLLFSKINSSGEIIQKFNYEFPLEVINRYESEKTRKANSANATSGKLGIRDLSLSNFIQHTDGSILFVGEQAYTEQGPILYRTNIYMSKFDANGNLVWISKIPRLQSFTYECSVLPGTKYITIGDTHYVIFVDVPKNENITIDIEPETYYCTSKLASLVVYTIDDTSGKYVRKSILDTKNINGLSATTFPPIKFVQVLPDTYILDMNLDYKKEALIKMQIK